MGILDVVKVGLVVAGGVVAVGNARRGEVGDLQVAVVVVGCRTETRLGYVLPGVVFDCEGVYICGCVDYRVADGSVASLYRYWHI